MAGCRVPRKVMAMALGMLVGLAWMARSIYVSFTEQELTKAMEELESLGFVPHHILDVGANEGNWADEARDYWAHGAPFFQIEANQALEHFLKEKGNPYKIAIVGDEEKTVTFHKLCDGGLCSGGSSVFVENTDWGPGMIKEERQMTTIDKILKDAQCVQAPSSYLPSAASYFPRLLLSLASPQALFLDCHLD